MEPYLSNRGRPRLTVAAIYRLVADTNATLPSVWRRLTTSSGIVSEICLTLSAIVRSDCDRFRLSLSRSR